MDFIKKNWGLLTGGIIALALAIVLISMVVKTINVRNEANKKVEDHMSFFKRLSDFGYNLEKTDENGEIFNLAQSKRNFQTAQEQSAAFRQQLIDKYGIEVEIPETASEAVRQLKARMAKIRKFLSTKGITANDIGAEFDDILDTGTISQEDFLPVFRQLAITDHILEIVAESGIKEVNFLSFPMGFTNVDSGTYTTTPFDISVFGSPEEVQNFLNAMTDDDKMLFYITDLVFNSPDVFTEGYEDMIGDYELADPTMVRNDTGMPGGSSVRAPRSMKSGPRASAADPMSRPTPTPSRRSSRTAAGRAGGLGGPIAGGAPGARAPRANRRAGAVGAVGAPDLRTGGRGLNGGIQNPVLGGTGNLTANGAIGMNGFEESRRIVLEPKRQDWIVFDQKIVELNVRFDLYEFVKPEAPAEESADEGATDDAAADESAENAADDAADDAEGEPEAAE